MKKLDKDQMNAVVNIIYDKVSPELKEKAKKEDETERLTITKQIKASPLYKTYVKLYNTPTLSWFHSVNILYNDAYAIIWKTIEQGTSTFRVSSPEELLKTIISFAPRNVKFNEYELKWKIRQQLIIASIDSNDLDDMIAKVIKLFK